MAKRKIRQLSISEQFYTDFKISVQLVCQLRGALTAAVLQTALNHVAIQHPLLACQITRENETLFFVHGGNHQVPLRILQNKDRDTVFHEELNTALDESQHLIRAVLLNDATLIITLHHAIADGLSSVQFIKTLLQTCGDIMKSGNPQTHDILPIQASIEELSSQLVTPAELSDFIDRFAQQAQSISLRAIEPRQSDDENAENICVFNVTLSHDNTRNLLQACKANQTSVHCAIAAAHLIAVRLCLEDSDTELMLRCNTPVDLRQRLNPPLENHHLLSAATGCGTNHAVSPKTPLWELAGEIGSSIQGFLASGDVFKAHLTFMDTLMKHRMPTAVGISSVGLINIPKMYHNLTCEAIYLTGVYRLPMFGVTVYTYDNQLVLTYLYVQPYYSTDLMQKISQLALHQLMNKPE